VLCVFCGSIFLLVRSKYEERQQTQTHADESEVNRLSRRIIGCALTVQSALGVGSLEKAYESALRHELRKAGLAVSQQQAAIVRYDGVVVGEYAVIARNA
jgi:hypothetical protein